MRQTPLVVAAAAILAGLAALAHRPAKAPSPPPVASAPAPSASVPPPSTAAPTASAPAPPAPRKRRGGMDLTFLVTADTHAGFWDKIPIPAKPSGVPLEKVHEIAIGAMNDIPGTRFPLALGGEVGTPRGLIIAGDLTEMGAPWEWPRFEVMFGLTGKEGWIHYPVYENIGNHDIGDGLVKAQVEKRHGASHYSWDWDDVHLVSFGEAPNDEEIAWLRADLAAAGPDVGVVIAFHFPLAGPFSEENWFAEGDRRDRFAKAIAGHHVLGIFNGHFHASGHYRWRGFDGYLQGSVKHSWHSFSVVHVTDTRFTVASYNYDRRAFWWWHDKPIFGAPGREASWSSPGDSIVRPGGR
jgi:hypothetical protein